MDGQPKVFTPILLGMLGVLFLLPAWLNEDWPLTLRWILAAIGMLFFFFAALTTLQWLAYHAANIAERLARARAITPETERLLALSMLSQYQLEALMLGYIAIEADVTLAGALTYYRVGKMRLPPEFVEGFFQGCTDTHLKPIRDYPDGNQRRWAAGITRWFIAEGLAREYIGNQASRWTIGKDTALRRFQLAQFDPEE